MRSICCEYEEAIWEHAHTGEALSEDAQRHIERCPECARAQIEASRLSTVFPAISDVPPAPDCRSAVMARISGPARRFSFAWTYACAAVLVAAVGLAYVVRPGIQHGGPATEVTATRTQSPPAGTPGSDRVAVRPVAPSNGVGLSKYVGPGFAIPDPSSRVCNPPSHVPAKRTARNNSRPPKARRQLPVVIAIVPPAPITELKDTTPSPIKADMPATGGASFPTPRPPSPDPRHLAADTRPVAIAVVTWPSASDQPADNYAYSYTERDPDTGAVTDCSVKRSGNSIDIRMEVKPEKKNPPVRGSVDYEPNSNA